MKFAALSSLFLSVFAVPTPSESTESNYNLLTDAINDFQRDSDYSWTLILTALSQTKTLLNSFSTSTVGNLTLYLPSDSGLLNLNLATLSENDLYTYLQYHVAVNSNCGDYVRTLIGDDIKVNSTNVVSSFDNVATILGSNVVNENVFIHFIDYVLTPPSSLEATAAHYNWTGLSAVLAAAKTAQITFSTGKENTFLIPSEDSIAAFVSANCPPDQWNTNFLQLLLESLSFSSGRYYSDKLSPAGGSIISNSMVDANYTITDGVVTFTEYGIAAPVIKADVFVQNGVAHVIDAFSLPSIKGYCQN